VITLSPPPSLLIQEVEKTAEMFLPMSPVKGQEQRPSTAAKLSQADGPPPPPPLNLTENRKCRRNNLLGQQPRQPPTSPSRPSPRRLDHPAFEFPAKRKNPLPSAENHLRIAVGGGVTVLSSLLLARDDETSANAVAALANLALSGRLIFPKNCSFSELLRRSSQRHHRNRPPPANKRPAR
jgi:hypothetical protein